MSTTEAELLPEIDAFLAVSGMSASYFGLKAVNDGKLVDRLRAGGDVTTVKAKKIRAFIAEHSEAGKPPDPQAEQVRVA